MILPDDPRELGLPHDSWRIGQRETAQWCLDLEGIGIISAPTGSGKTSFAASCAYGYPTTTLCRTKNLQQENYGDMYSFDVLFGRGNYRCIHPQNPDATCAECIYVEQGSGRGMSDCKLSHKCLYLNQKALVMGSRRASLNYAYWLSAAGIRSCERDYLFLDECHQLSDLVLEWSGITVNEADRVSWGLPRFPLANSRAKVTSSLVQIDEDVSLNEVRKWLADSLRVLEPSLRRTQHSKPTAEEQKQATELEQFIRKLSSTLEALEYGPDDWFVQSGPTALTWGGEKRPGMLVKPLTARFHFPRYFPSGNGSKVDEVLPRCILMSATVGDFDTFAKELGIAEFSSRRVPSQWAPERRPVYALDVPKLNYKSEDKDYDAQAQAIAQAILTVPSDWCGIVHVTRKKESALLAERLAQRGLQGRVWVPDQGSTTWMAKQWERRKRRVSGSLMISHAFHEGFDGLSERICVSAKVPYAYLGDPYEMARQRRSGSFYLQRAAWSLMQQLGRTRRGREQDYDTGDERRGLCLIADASWSKLGGFGKGKRYLSEDFVEAVREWPS